MSKSQFPSRLHSLLETCEREGETSITWLPGGTSFQVVQKERFAQVIMPVHFRSSIYKSFQRNLNLWGFRAVSKENGLAIYCHELFRRGEPDLCQSMARAGCLPSCTVERARPEVTEGSVSTRRIPLSIPGSTYNDAPIHNYPLHLGSSGDLSLSNPTGTQSASSSIYTLQEPAQRAAANLFLDLIIASRLQHANALAKQDIERLLNRELVQAIAAAGCNHHAPTVGHFSSNIPSTSRDLPLAPILAPPQLDYISSASPSCVNRKPLKKRKLPDTDDVQSAFSETVVKHRRQSQPNVDVFPCRARAMPLDHNPHSAFFEVDSNTITHGFELVCSHHACRRDGTKFRFCAICRIPASKRTFSYFHSHRDSQEGPEERSPAVTKQKVVARTMALPIPEDDEESATLVRPVERPLPTRIAVSISHPTAVEDEQGRAVQNSRDDCIGGKAIVSECLMTEPKNSGEGPCTTEMIGSNFAAVPSSCTDAQIVESSFDKFFSQYRSGAATATRHITDL